VVPLACDGPNRDRWYDQLEADGPCHRANLSDGLDETATDELHDVFDCLNQGNLEPLALTVDSLDSPARDHLPAGLALARTLNGLPTDEVDLWGLLNFGEAWLTSTEGTVSDWAAIGVELIYAQPYSEVLSTGPDWSQSAVDDGVIAPLLVTLPPIAGATLDSEGDVLGVLDTLIRSERADKLFETFQEIVHAESGLPADLADNLILELGEALVATQNGANDRWPASTGNSLTDAGVALLALENDVLVIESVLDPAWNILNDTIIETKLRSVLGELYDDGHLDAFPSQLLVLASVDANGGSVAVGEDSALVSLIRLLAEANQDLDCTVGIWGWGFTVPNPSVWFLQQLAAQDPEDAADGIEIYGSTLSWTVFQELFGYVGSQCGLSSQFDTDLEAIQRLSDDEVGDLLVVLLTLLQAFEEGQTDRIPDLVNVLSAIHDQSVSHPLEEALRDLLDTALVVSLIDAAPLLLEPASHYDSDFNTANAFDFEELWEMLAASADLAGDSPLPTFRLVLATLGEEEAPWQAVDHLGDLMANEDAKFQSLLSLYTAMPKIAGDGDRASEESLLTDEAWTQDLLIFLETEAFAEALGSSSKSNEGPLPFAARLVTNQTLDSLLQTLELALDAMR